MRTDAVRALFDRLEIVADRLLARNVGERAEDGREEAGHLGFAALADQRTLGAPGLGSI